VPDLAGSAMHSHQEKRTHELIDDGGALEIFFRRKTHGQWHARLFEELSIKTGRLAGFGCYPFRPVLEVRGLPPETSGHSGGAVNDNFVECGRREGAISHFKAIMFDGGGK